MIRDQEVRVISIDLGLEEMDDPGDDDMSGGSQCCVQSIGDGQ